MVGTTERVSNYYSIAFGKVVRSYGGNKPEGNIPGLQQRTNKNGKVVYETFFDYIKGNLVKAELGQPPQDRPELGETLKLTFTSGSDSAMVQIKFDSAYGRGFCFALPNIDLNQEVNLQPYSYMSKKKNKEVMGLSVLQGVEQLPWAYTKENPNGIPQLEKVMFKGAEQWDNSKQLEFLRNSFLEFCQVVDAFNSKVAEDLPANGPADMGDFEEDFQDDEADFFESASQGV